MSNVYGPVDQVGWNALLACRNLIPWYRNRGSIDLCEETKKQYSEILEHYKNNA